MKKLKITSLLIMLGMLSFLTACEQKTETPSPIPTPPASVPMTPAQEMVANFAPQLGKTAADISKTNFEERVNFEGLSARKIEETLNLKERNANVDAYLEGRVAYQNADGPGMSVRIYLKDRIICRISEEYENDESDEAEPLSEEEYEKAMENMTIGIEFACADIPEERISPLDLTFDMQGTEPFWDATLRLDNLKFRNPTEEINLLLSNYKKEGGKLIFSGDHFKKGEFNGSIRKAPCNDDMSETEYPYQVKLTIGEEKYEGCAHQVDNFLVTGREGIFSNLLKKIGYSYQGKRDPKAMRYHQIESKGNLLAFTISWDAPKSDEYEENWQYLVLEKTSNGWEKLWDGLYPVDTATCEKYANRTELMDFGVFESCPKG